MAAHAMEEEMTREEFIREVITHLSSSSLLPSSPTNNSASTTNQPPDPAHFTVAEAKNAFSALTFDLPLVTTEQLRHLANFLRSLLNQLDQPLPSGLSRVNLPEWFILNERFLAGLTYCNGRIDGNAESDYARELAAVNALVFIRLYLHCLREEDICHRLLESPSRLGDLSNAGTAAMVEPLTASQWTSDNLTRTLSQTLDYLGDNPGLWKTAGFDSVGAWNRAFFVLRDRSLQRPNGFSELLPAIVKVTQKLQADSAKAKGFGFEEKDKVMNSILLATLAAMVQSPACSASTVAEKAMLWNFINEHLSAMNATLRVSLDVILQLSEERELLRIATAEVDAALTIFTFFRKGNPRHALMSTKAAQMLSSAGIHRNLINAWLGQLDHCQSLERGIGRFILISAAMLPNTATYLRKVKGFQEKREMLNASNRLVWAIVLDLEEAGDEMHKSLHCREEQLTEELLQQKCAEWMELLETLTLPMVSNKVLAWDQHKNLIAALKAFRVKLLGTEQVESTDEKDILAKSDRKKRLCYQVKQTIDLLANGGNSKRD